MAYVPDGRLSRVKVYSSSDTPAVDQLASDHLKNISSGRVLTGKVGHLHQGRGGARHEGDGDWAFGIAPLQGERLALKDFIIRVEQNRLGEHGGGEGQNRGDSELHGELIWVEYSVSDGLSEAQTVSDKGDQTMRFQWRRGVEVGEMMLDAPSVAPVQLTELIGMLWGV